MHVCGRSEQRSPTHRHRHDCLLLASVVGTAALEPASIAVSHVLFRSRVEGRVISERPSEILPRRRGTASPSLTIQADPLMGSGGALVSTRICAGVVWNLALQRTKLFSRLVSELIPFKARVVLPFPPHVEQRHAPESATSTTAATDHVIWHQ